MDLARRCHESERMDAPNVPFAPMALALDELDRINVWLGGHGGSLALLRRRLLGAGGPVRLLDVGAGGGGTAIALHRWAARHDVDLRIVLVDLHAAVCGVAAANVRDQSAIRLTRADAFRLPFADGAFDYVHSSLFLHHFRNEQIVPLLAEMDRVAAHGVVVNDLHRHWFAYQSIRLLGALFIRSPIVRHDAPLSVRRGFRASDLERWRRSGRPRPGYRWRWPFRWLVWSFADGGTPEGAADRA